ncbi:hypothetical protein BJ912DRAFT_1147181 [Pholiota molesta]|nr:hypothetical protein BJ912DRAFT_1147181 [Pholiota molesta]
MIGGRTGVESEEIGGLSPHQKHTEAQRSALSIESLNARELVIIHRFRFYIKYSLFRFNSHTVTKRVLRSTYVSALYIEPPSYSSLLVSKASTATMPSATASSPRNSISRIPNAVLREIFNHCRPHYPLKAQQPSTRIAPLLLCRICSSWRTVALASTALWSHLTYCLTVCGDDETELIKDDVEFIRWWRNNQGTTVAPYLRFSVKTKKRREIKQELSADGMGFVLEYIMSAQYLELDAFYWERIQERIEAGDVFGFPHLHTLAKSQRDEDELFCFHQVQDLLQTHTAPVLRRLFVKSDELHPSEGASIQLPALWSTLTHLSLHDLELSLDIWFTVTRAVPNLEWAYIDIARLTDFEDPTDAMEPFSLRRLLTFCVAFRDADEDASQFVFSVLFAHLCLPAVHTLSLSWVISDGWYNHGTTAALYTILQCAPAVTTLALAENFLDLVDPGSPPVDIAARGRVDPVWTHTPCLVHLQLEVPQESTRERSEEDIEEGLDVFVRDTLFSDGSWLDLCSPACPIRTVTIVAPAPPPPVDLESDEDEDEDDKSNGSQSDAAFVGGMGKFTMARIQKLADQAPNVVFQLSSTSASHIAAEMSNQWAWRS